MSASERGTLFLVVGPSGAGKDTLIAAARDALAGDARYLFARRVVTRPEDAGGELHEAATREQFAALCRAAAFALHWSAHGLSYGIRSESLAPLAAGRHVVVNVSRAIIAEARVAFAPSVVIAVTAAPEVLARRVAARGREDAAAVAERLARAAPIVEEARLIDNSGDLDTAIAAFLAALRPVT